MAAMLKSATSKAACVRAAPAKANKMMVWQPKNNKYFETFSFLPPLDDDQIAAQVDYIVDMGWTPSLEIAEADVAYTSNENCVRMTLTPGYYDNRYWTMYKLPMFGCTDASQVLKEIDNATRQFPNSYVRLAAFDADRQVQVAAMLVQRPAGVKDYRLPNERSVGDVASSGGAAASSSSASRRPARRSRY